MNIKSFIKYSVILGLLISIPIYFETLSRLDDARHALVVEALVNSSKVNNIIGSYQGFSVRKITNYDGAPGDPPYSRYLLKVSGVKGNAMVWVIVSTVPSETEYVSEVRVRE